MHSISFTARVGAAVICALSLATADAATSVRTVQLSGNAQPSSAAGNAEGRAGAARRVPQ